jgi:hypothetical protein
MMLFWDSFAHYDSLVLMAQKWDAVQAPFGLTSATLAQAINTGRFGGGGVTFSSNSNVTDLRNDTSPGLQVPQYIQKNYSGVSVIHVGLAFQQNATQLARGSRLLTFLDGATTQVGIDIMPSGQLRIVRASAVGSGIYLVSFDPTPPESGLYTVEATTANSILSSGFDFLQFRITHHPTAGIVEILRGDGSAFETISNINTAVSGNNRSSSVLAGGYGALIGGAAGNVECHYLRGVISDFHLLNTVANGDDALDPVTFCGDRHWERITLTADGNYTQWTPSTGTTHFDLIEEVPPNTTDYNSSSTVGNKDSFIVSAAGGPPAASAFLGLTMYLQKTSGGGDEVKGLFRLAGADRNGTAFLVPSPFAFRQSFLASKPGGGAITVADVQPATGQPGYEKTA